MNKSNTRIQVKKNIGTITGNINNLYNIDISVNTNQNQEAEDDSSEEDNDDSWVDNSEIIEYEEIDQSSQLLIPENQTQTIIDYLSPLDAYLLDTAKVKLLKILSDEFVLGWLFEVKQGQRVMNKNKVYKLVNLLKYRGHIYDQSLTGVQMDLLLEKATSDTNQRKSMNRKYKDDDMINKIIDKASR